MDQTNEATSASGRRLEANHEENADSPVGYGKPPKHGRFKPGQSGNKRGRPRGSKNRKTILMQIANETHRVIEDGRPRDRTTLELMLLTLRNLAAEGNVRAFRIYESLLTKYTPQEIGSDAAVLLVPAPLTPMEFIEKINKANAEKKDPRTRRSRSPSK